MSQIAMDMNGRNSTKSVKRDEVLQAALDLFAEYGFHGTSMAMISEQAKVGAGTIYRYFKSKDELIVELFKEVNRTVSEAFKSEVIDELSFQKRFLHMGKFLFRYLVNHPNLLQYLEQFLSSPYGVDVRKDRINRKDTDNAFLEQFFREGTAKREIKDLPENILIALTLSPIIVFARDHILNFYTLDDQMLTRALEACWDGVKRHG